jgi:PAS domain S-box-containing protein
MKIKTKLQISTLLTLSIALIIGLILFWSAVNTNNANEEGKRGIEIVQRMNQLQQITDTFLNNPTEKSELQWYSNFNTVSKLLSANFSNQKSQITAENIRQNLGDIQTILLQLKSDKNIPIESTKKSIIDKIVKSQDMAVQLSYSLQIDASDYESKTNSLILLSIGVIIILIGSFSFIIRRNLAEPINKLYEGTKLIGAGDLQHKINLNTNDEIGRLGQSFDEMTFKLKGFYEDLEGKIQERTNEISLRMKEIQKINIKLEKEKSQSYAILTSLAEGMVVINDKAKVVFINQAMRDILGQTEKQLIYKDIFDCLVLEQENGSPVTKEESPVYSALKKGQNIIDDKRFHLLTKNKKKIEISVTVSAVIVKSKITGVIISIRDITKEKEIQRMKDEFLSFAAHQLRTPLGSMRWNLEIMLTGSKEKIPAEITEKLQQMYESNIRLINLINELLDVSSIDEGKSKDFPEATDLLKIIEEEIKEIENFADMRKIAIIVNQPKEPIPEIMVDPKHFKEVISNLLSNSVKYNKVAGQIEIDFIIRKKKLLLTIADTGIGIPENDQKLVFTKFFRAHNAVLQQTEGTGLGLFMVKFYVEQWGAKIRLESKENEYTKYFLEFNIP